MITHTSRVHRVFECNSPSTHVSTQDASSCIAYRRALCAYRDRYTSVLPLDDDLQEYPRSDRDYLFWLTCSHMLIVESDLFVRPLNEVEMQALADASHGLHLLYIKYSLMMAPPSSLPLQPATSRRALSARGANLSDCALISSRLPHCRLSDEFVDWYQA